MGVPYPYGRIGTVVTRHPNTPDHCNGASAAATMCTQLIHGAAEAVASHPAPPPCATNGVHGLVGAVVGHRRRHRVYAKQARFNRGGRRSSPPPPCVCVMNVTAFTSTATSRCDTAIRHFATTAPRRRASLLLLRESARCYCRSAEARVATATPQKRASLLPRADANRYHRSADPRAT